MLGSQQVSNLLNTTEVKSADYNSIKALVQGDIDTFMGFKFLRSERLNLASTQRKCFAFTKGAMGLGIGKDVTTKIDVRQTSLTLTRCTCHLSLAQLASKTNVLSRFFVLSPKLQ